MGSLRENGPIRRRAGAPDSAPHLDLSLGGDVVNCLNDHALGSDGPVGIGGGLFGHGIAHRQGPHRQQADNRHHQEHRELNPHVVGEERRHQPRQRAHAEPDGDQAHRGGLYREEQHHRAQPRDSLNWHL